jgi:hypothetical protein
MARPLKEGLDYFPLDTNFDEKIQAIESVFKNDGLVWIIKFWQSAYRTNDGEVSLDGYQGIIHAENSRITLEKQKEILKLCVEIGLLTKTNNKKYTSNGIKKRLRHIIEERKRWRIEHKLPVIQADNPRDNLQETGESKVKESKVKKSKEDKESIFVFLQKDLFLKTWGEYLEMRQKIRKPATDRAKEMVLTELHKHDLETAIKMLEQSILNSWQGVFPLKEKNSNLTKSQRSNLEGLKKTIERIEHDKREFPKGVSGVGGILPGTTI